MVAQLHAFDHLMPHLGVPNMLIGSSTMAVYLGFQMVSALLLQWYPDRKSSVIIILIGLMLWFIGVFASTYCLTYTQFHVVYTLFVGVGSSISLWGGVHLMLQIDHLVYHSLPIYIVATAGALGDVIYAFGIAPSLSIDWRQTQRIFAICGLSIGTIALLILYISRPPEYTLLLTDTNKPSQVSFKVYILTVIGVGLGAFALMAPQDTTSMDMMDMGLASYIPLVSSTHSIGTLVGKLTPLAIIPWYKPTLTPLAISYLVSTGLLAVWFAVSTPATWIVFAFCSGVAYGACTSFLMGFVHRLGNSHVRLVPYTLVQVAGVASAGTIYESITTVEAKKATFVALQGAAGITLLLSLFGSQIKSTNKNDS